MPRISPAESGCSTSISSTMGWGTSLWMNWKQKKRRDRSHAKSSPFRELLQILFYGNSATGNALLYISLSSVVLIASFTNSAILNDRFAICNSRLLSTNQIVNCNGRVRPGGRALFFSWKTLRLLPILESGCHSNRQSCGNLLKCSAVGYV